MEPDRTFADYFARAQAEVLIPREQQILELRYGIASGQTRTLEQVGQRFRLTRERIRQLSAGALRRIHTSARRNLALGHAMGACAGLVLYLERACRPDEPGHLDRVIAFAQTALPHLPPRTLALPLLTRLLCPPVQRRQCLRDLCQRYKQRSTCIEGSLDDTPDQACPNPACHRHPVAAYLAPCHGQHLPDGENHSAQPANAAEGEPLACLEAGSSAWTCMHQTNEPPLNCF